VQGSQLRGVERARKDKVTGHAGMTTVSYSETLQQLVEPLRLVLVQGVQRGAKETPKGVQGVQREQLLAKETPKGVQGVQRDAKGCNVEQRNRPKGCKGVQGVQRGAKETPKGVQGVQGVQRGVKGCSVEQRKRPNTFNVKSLKTSEFKYLSVIK